MTAIGAAAGTATGEGPKDGEPGFDARLARLEEIVAELEHGGIALEPAIDRYQEGVELLASCRSILAGYRKRVEELSDGAGLAVRPYDADPDAGCESAG